MIIYLCIKFQSNTPILSKDIARKPKVFRTGRTDRTDVHTDSSDTIRPPPPPHPPTENGGGIQKLLSATVVTGTLRVKDHSVT